MSNGSLRETVIAPGSYGGLFNFRELYGFRGLLYMLAWRDVKVRYKQSVLGVAWVVLKPLMSMLIFAAIFGRLAKLPSDGAPYPVFVMAGIITWGFFSASVSGAAQSVVAGSSLVGKVYFPRLIIPLASSAANLVDLLVSCILFAALLAFYHITPGPAVLLAPVALISMFIAAAGPGLLFSALYVRYRDMGYIVPFLVQVWMYATPVIYPASFIPERFRWMVYLNPMAGVIELFRWTLLPGTPLEPGMVMLSAAVGVLLFCAGYLYFRKVEKTFADEI